MLAGEGAGNAVAAFPAGRQCVASPREAITLRFFSVLQRKSSRMPYVIKAEIKDPKSRVFEFAAAKTMYGGRRIGEGDIAFLFASENEGGSGLFARTIVTYAAAVSRVQGAARQTPRMDVRAEPTAIAKRPLGRAELRHFKAWDDGRAETELNFKLYRQATNKIVGISEETARFLEGFV